MDFIGRSTVIEYVYKDEFELKRHEEKMRKEGWFISSKNRLFGKKDELYREYRQRAREGVFF